MNMYTTITAFGIAAALATASPLAAQTAGEPSDSVFSAGAQEGGTTAQTVGTGTWTLGGFAGGVFLGPVGAGLAYALATSSASSLPAPIVTRIGKKDTHFQLAFQQAYTDKLTAKRRSSALVGGLAGTTLFGVGAAVLLGR